MLKRLIREYSETSSIHGVNLLANPSLSRFGKFWWRLSFTLSVGLCIWLVADVFMRNKEHHYIIFFQPFYGLKEIVYPLLAICPKLFNESKFVNYSEFDLNEEEVYELSSRYSRFCGQSLKPHNDSGVMNIDFCETLKKVTPDPSSIFYSCSLGGAEFDCSLHIEKRVYSQGICYIFNPADMGFLYRTDNIQPNIDEHTHPRIVVSGYGSSGKIQINMAIPKTQSEELCSHKDNHVTIGVDWMFNTMMLYTPMRKALPGRTYDIHFENRVLEKSVEINLNEIKCQFIERSFLKYYNLYLEELCEVECLAALTETTCNCTPFYLPSYRGMPICSFKSEECVRTAHFSYFSNRNQNKDICNCIPNCQLYWLKVDITSFETSNLTLMNAIHRSNASQLTLTDYNHYTFNIFSNQRYIIINLWFNGLTIAIFISFIGGLMGLVLGMSFMSVFEIIYFIFMKPILIYKNRRSVAGAAQE